MASRREFIKFVVSGSVAAGCPIDKTLLAAPEFKSPGGPLVHGEHLEVCHQVRDGHQFKRPEATRKADVVIVGGGVAGLSAAYFLRGKEWLLLEKEPQLGGNALAEEFAGQLYATGSAYAYRGDESDQLAAEIGLKLPLVNMPDPTIVNKTYVPDTWKAGLDQLPYPRAVRESFKKFRDDLMKIPVREKMAELDALPFTNFAAPYAPEVQQWWDGCGPSNWGATSEDSSAYYRRGHPMFMAVPGRFTKDRPAASHPLDRIFFGNCDSGGPESLTSEAVRLSNAGAEWAELVLAGKPGAKELAEKALAAISE